MDLSQIRKEIDALDDQIAELLNRRMDIAARIAEYKKRGNIKITDGKREEEIFNRICTGENAEELRLAFGAIINASKLKQEKVFESAKATGLTREEIEKLLQH